jgi:hypothetical protein
MRVLGVNTFDRMGDKGGFARVHPAVKARGKAGSNQKICMIPLRIDISDITY